MKKKIAIILIVLTLVSATFTLTPFAQQSEEPATDGTVDDIIDDEVPADEDSNANEGKPDDDASIFEEAYRLFCDNLPEVLTALSLAVSALLALLYKKGLIPMLSNALSGILGAVRSIGPSAEKNSESLGAATDGLSKRLDLTEDVIRAMGENLDSLGKSLGILSANRRDSEVFITLFESQNRLIYELLEGSNIPESRKEQIRESFRRAEDTVRRMRDEDGAVADPA